MSEKIEQMVQLVQERCLWQFHSRAWDREEVIQGVLNRAEQLLTGQEHAPATPAEKCYHADAKFLVADLRARFPWLAETSPAEVQALLAGLRERLREITITKSQNCELHVENY